MILQPFYFNNVQKPEDNLNLKIAFVATGKMELVNKYFAWTWSMELFKVKEYYDGFKDLQPLVCLQSIIYNHCIQF